MSVGGRIAERRKEKGWTQAGLAQAAQVSASAIAMYETNRRIPDDNVLQKIAAALDTEVRLLLDAQDANELAATVAVTDERHSTDTAQSNINLTTFSLTREEARIILFLRMNPQYKPFLESYAVADDGKRQQLERTWKLIHAFQK